MSKLCYKVSIRMKALDFSLFLTSIWKITLFIYEKDHTIQRL